MTKIALDELRPNPFRDIKRLPPKPEKVAILKESIKETSFWDNIVCRKAPNGSGGYEIAYGHNRLEALRQLKYTEVNIPVREIDNDTMAKIMARENHEEWGAYSEVDAETARAVIEAFAEGKITLPPVKGGTPNYRVAPSFSVGTSEMYDVKKLYSAATLGQFLGWSPDKTVDVLKVLGFQEQNSSKGINLVGLTTNQAASVVEQSARVKKETDDAKAAISIAKQLAQEFRSGNAKASGRKDNSKRTVSTVTAAARANELMREARVKRHVANKKAKAETFNLQKQDRQVATFLDACKAWMKAVESAGIATSKFSPEAKKFTLRKLNEIGNAEVLLKGRLK